MSLFLNRYEHWQIQGGVELHNGDRVELLQNGEWICTQVNFRPQTGYVLRFDNGTELALTETMQVRAVRDPRTC